MTPDAKKKLIGAIVAAALAIAVYYGLIDQKQADNIRTQADQTLGTGNAPQQQQPQTTGQPAPPQAPTPAPAPQADTPPAQH